MKIKTYTEFLNEYVIWDWNYSKQNTTVVQPDTLESLMLKAIADEKTAQASDKKRKFLKAFTYLNTDFDKNKEDISRGNRTAGI